VSRTRRRIFGSRDYQPGISDKRKCRQEFPRFLLGKIALGVFLVQKPDLEFLLGYELGQSLPDEGQSLRLMPGAIADEQRESRFGPECDRHGIDLTMQGLHMKILDDVHIYASGRNEPIGPEPGADVRGNVQKWTLLVRLRTGNQL
jgi:hypothetical protein